MGRCDLGNFEYQGVSVREVKQAFMKSKVNIVQVSLVVAIIIGILVGVSIAVTLALLGGGWLVNWMFPTISYEFASVIAGQGLLIAVLLLAMTAHIVAKAIARQELEEQNSDDDDIDEDTDSAEAAEWLAERIADITHAKLTQTAPKSRRYTAKPRGK